MYFRFLRQSAAPALALLTGMLLAACGPSGPKTLHQSQQIAGTLVEISASGPKTAVLERAATAAFQEMTRLADMMNPDAPASAISAVNAAAGLKPVAVPAEFMEVLSLAQAAARRSGGAFDITLGAVRGWRFDRKDPHKPDDAGIAAQRTLVDFRALRLDPGAHTAFLTRRGMRIGLDGAARPYLVQAGMRVLREHGIGHALISMEGSAAALGGSNDRPWRIGIPDPRAPHEMLGVLAIERGFAVTSGEYEHFFMARDGQRYHHVLDPRTGRPTRGALGVTLVSNDLPAISGMAAAIMALDLPAGRALIEKTPGLEGLIVGRDGALWMSEGFKAHFKPGRPLPGDS
jgi:thiamine biosynthesis lipoprotein